MRKNVNHISFVPFLFIQDWTKLAVGNCVQFARMFCVIYESHKVINKLGLIAGSHVLVYTIPSILILYEVQMMQSMSDCQILASNWCVPASINTCDIKCSAFNDFPCSVHCQQVASAKSSRSFWRMGKSPVDSQPLLLCQHASMSIACHHFS